MKGSYLGEFEELVLLLIVYLGEDAYGLMIREKFMEQTGRSAAIGAIHSALNRLEEKGFCHSHLADPTSERGGRRKRIFQLTAAGKSALEKSRELRNSIWEKIPPLNWESIS